MDKNKQGFTLIELIVVFSIIAVVSALSLAKYNEFNEEKRLEDEGKRLTGVLNLVYKKASTGDLLSSCSDFRGYQFVVTSGTSYKFQFVCGSTSSDVQSYTVNQGINLNPSALSVLFRPLAAGTDLSSNSTIKVKDTVMNPDKCIDITISPIGTVTEGSKYTSGC